MDDGGQSFPVGSAAGFTGSVLAWVGVVALTVLFTAPFALLRGWLLAGSSLLAVAGLVYACFFWRSCRFTLTNEYIEFHNGILYQVSRRIRRSSIMAGL